MSQPYLVTADPASPHSPELARAAALLRDGGLVAFPTETVYGLGAHALDAGAVARVFRVKGRPADNPLIVHLGDAAELGRVAGHITPLAAELAARFWPGPLTLVLEAAPGVPGLVTAGLGTVAVRVPGHPVALALLEEAGVPVAAPSANRSGRPSPTTAQHVLDDLAEDIDALVDGGPSELGVESTVVDARGDQPVVLREGAVSREELGVGPGRPGAPGPAAHASSPGTRHAHYQPDCRVELVAPGAGAMRAAMLSATGRVGLVMAATSAPPPDAAGVAAVGAYLDATDLAANLYAWLRRAEGLPVDVLVVESVDERGVGRAVMDRLRRAADA